MLATIDSHIKKMTVDSSSAVRFALCEVAREWLIELPERIDVAWMSLPFSLCNDGMDKTRDYNHETLKLVSDLVETECRDQMKDILDYDQRTFY